MSRSKQDMSVLEYLRQQGISRRAFLKFCVATASSLALPMGADRAIAKALASGPRLSVIWLNFQECTGCTESLTRSFRPPVDNLLFNVVSLDYHETLMAAAGTAAEAARQAAMARARGKYVLIVEGAVPLSAGYSTVGGADNLAILRECLDGAAVVIAAGTCSAFGGLPAAAPNPTQARSVGELMAEGAVPSRPIVNLPGCPPIPEVLAGTLVHYVTYGVVPALDAQRRPQVYYGQTVHDRCARLHFYQARKFALTFDDEGARHGWCLLHLGCRGPDTHNACTAVKWNGETSYPMYAGHGCLGCAEPNFWDRGSFYTPKGRRRRGA